MTQDIRNRDEQASDRLSDGSFGWSDLSTRIRRSWLAGLGIFSIGILLHWVFAVAAIAKMLILGGLGWLARDTSIAISSRLKRSRENADGRGASHESESTEDEATPASETSTAAAAAPTSTLDVEEQIIELLDDNDGQLRQKYLVQQVDRSKATVSKYLSNLEDEGEIVKFSRGRENIVYRPYAVPEQIKADD